MIPVGTNIMVRIPSEQKEGVRKLESGIYIPALLGNFHNDFTYGEVVAVGEHCTNVMVGDTVFYSQMSIQQALQNNGQDRTRNETIKDNPNNIPCFMYEDENGEYLIFPSEKVSIECSDISGTHYNTIFQSVICAIRNGEVICLNGHYLFNKAYDDGVLIDGVKGRTTPAGLILPQMKEADEKTKRFKCLYAPVDGVIGVGDIFFTAPHCDIKLEGDFNNPFFPADTYYVEEHNILGVFGEDSFEPIAQTDPTLQKPIEVHPSE